MSEAANVQLIKELYDRLGKGDLETALGLMTDDVTFVVPGPPGIGAAGTWRGHNGVRECFARLREAQENQSASMYGNSWRKGTPSSSCCASSRRHAPPARGSNRTLCTSSR